MKRFLDKAIAFLLVFSLITGSMQAAFAAPAAVYNTQASYAEMKTSSDQDKSVSLDSLVDSKGYLTDQGLESLQTLPYDPQKYIEDKVDGKKTRTIKLFSKPINYKDSEGKYRSIDNSIVAADSRTKDQYQYKNASSDIQILMSTDLNQDSAIQVNYKDYSIGFKPISVLKENEKSSADINFVQSGSEGQTDASFSKSEKYNAVDYKGTFDSKTDIRIMPLSDGVKEDIILNELPSVSEFSYELAVKNIIPILREDGNLYFIDLSKALVVAMIPVPCMYDSSPESGMADVAVTLQKTGDSTYQYTLHPDQEYLKSATYPVVIDPTINTQTAGIYDTYVRSSSPSANYSGTDYLVVGVTSSGIIYRTLARINATGLTYIQNNTQGDTISSVKYYAYECYVGSSSPTIEVHPITAGWTYNTVHWSNQPAFSSAALTSTVVQATGWYSWNITSVGLDWYYGTTSHYGQTTYGILLKNSNETQNKYKEFYSDQNGSNKDYFQFTFTDTTGPNWGTGWHLETNPNASTSWTTDTTPIISWGGITDIGGSGLAKAQYQVNSGAWTDIPTGNGIASGSYTLPALASSGTYTISVRGVDGNGNTGTPKPVTYKLDTTSGPSPVITSPVSNTIVTGSVAIRGTVTSYSGITNWKLEYVQGTATTGWTQFATGSSAVSTEATLGTLNTSSLAEGSLYTIRLTATNGVGVSTSTSRLVIVNPAGMPGNKNYWSYSGFSTGSGAGSVNVASGNLVYQSTDFSYPSLLPMAMTRTYNSHSKFITALGQGWDFAFNIKLYPISNGGMMIKEGDGTLERFSSSGGVYTAENGLFMKLQKLTDNTWKATRKDNIQYLFDTGMKLYRIADLNGNYLQFAYNADGTISTVISSASEAVTFAYYTASDSGGIWTGLLKTATDPAGRVFTYTYNSSRQLISRSFPLTETTNWTEQFAYNASGLVSGITDGRGNQTTLLYDTGKRVTRVTYPITSLYMTYTYDDVNHKTTVANQLGQGTTYTYNTNGLVTRITDPLWTSDATGHYTSYTYDPTKYLVTATSTTKYNPVDLSSETVESSYTYDANGNMTLSIDPLGHRTVYEYNSLNLVTYQRTKAIDNVTDYTVTHYVYDANGNLTSETDPINHTTTHTYYSNGLLHTTTDNFSNTTTYTYNSHGWLTLTEDSSGASTATSTFDAMGNPLIEFDVYGNATNHQYDALGRLTKQYQGSESSIQFGGGSGTHHTPPLPSFQWTNDTYSATYDNNGNVTQSESNEGTVTNYVYDTMNRCTSMTVDPITTDNPDGKNAVTGYVYSYDTYNNFVIQTTDEVGNISREYYNANDQLIKTEGNNTTVNYTYDSIGNQTRTIDNEGKESKTVYDKLNRQTDAYEDPSGKNIHTSSAYDLLGNVTAQNDGQGTTTTSIYDLAGRATSVTVSKNDVDTITTYTYDVVVTEGTIQYVTNSSSEQLVYNGVTHDNGSKTTYVDGAGNTYKEISTLAGGTIFTTLYNSTGSVVSIKVGTTNPRELAHNTYDDGTGSDLLTRVTYGNGDWKQYTYNDDGQMTHEKYDSDTSFRYDFGYDDVGNLNNVKDHARNIETKYSYDDANRITGVEEGVINFTTATHSYTITYTDNNVTGISELVNGQTNAIAYTYNSDNRITDANYNYGTSNTAKVHWGYDEYDRITSRDVYDDNTTQIFNTSTTYTENTYATAYIQTILNRQIGSSGYDKTLTYEYDNDNPAIKDYNITKVSDGTYETTYVYDKKQQLIRENNQAASKTWTWEYDDGGNITYKKEYAYTTGTLGTPLSTIPYTYADTRGWADMLTSYDGNTITYDDSGNPLTDGTWTYTWEAGRNLVGMSKSGTTITYTYNKDGIRTSKTVNGVTTQYTLNGDKVTAEINGTDTIIYRYDNNDKLISMNLNDTEYYYFRNAQGDIVGLFDRLGNVVVEYTYDAWGNILSTTGSLASTVGVMNPYRYRGYRYDEETDCYYLQSRYYNPHWGRFVNADAVLLTDVKELSLQAYCYCENNPIKYYDPSGYIIETILDVGGIIWSLYDYILKPSWANFGFLAWDVAATFIPGVPGSYTVKGVKLTAKLVGSFNDVTRWTAVGGKLGVKLANSISDIARMRGVYLDTYNNLRRIFRAPGIEIHHLVEQRFRELFRGIGTGSYLSIPLPTWLHREITNRWYRAITYGTNYSKLSKSYLIAAAAQVYYDMPAIKNQVIRWIERYYKPKPGK